MAPRGAPVTARAQAQAQGGLRFAGVGRVFAPAVPGAAPVVALDGVSFEVGAGSRTAIVGPSGAGKSSLLHIAAGLDTGYTGTVVRPGPGTVVGYAFQDHRLLPWLTVTGNVTFALRAAGWPRPAATDRALAVLAAVGLSPVATAYPATLSGGMRQRAALARAFAVRPALLLLDEPFAAVDEEQADELCGLLSAEADAAGATVLVVTHRIREACQLADRTVVVRAGQVVAEVETGRHRPGSAGVDQAAARLRRAVAAATPWRSR